MRAKINPINITKYLSCFLDGMLVSLNHYEDSVDLTMISSPVDPEEFSNIPQSADCTFRGILHLKGVHAIKIANRQFEGTLKMIADVGDIANIKLSNEKLYMDVFWINFEEKTNDEFYSYVINFEELIWEPMANLSRPPVIAGSGCISSISKYAGYFHDGTLLSIAQRGTKLEFSMISAQVDQEIVRNIPISSGGTIEGVLHIEGVKSIKIDGESFQGILKMLEEDGGIASFRVKNKKIFLEVFWKNYKEKTHEKFYTYEIEAESTFWESVPNLEERLNSKF